MIRVIVADDEYFGRKVLVKKLMEMPEEIEICGEAEDGLEVMELLKTREADLVITDIKMPEMDGLQVAERISLEYPEISVIIESGYADFQYATTAMRFGVKDYLTKPVKQEELERAVRRAREEKKKEKSKIGQFMDFSRILENEAMSHAILTDFYKEMEQGTWYLVTAQSVERNLEEEQIRNILSLWDGHGAYFQPKNEFIFLFHGKKEENLSEILNKKRNKCVVQMNVHLDVGVSHVFEKTENPRQQLTAAYRETVYAVNRRLLRPSGKIYFYDSDFNVKALFSVAEERELEGSLRDHKIKEAEKIVGKLFAQCKKDDTISIYSLFASLIQIINVVNRVYCTGNHENKQPQLLFHFKSDLYTFRTLDEVHAYILQLLSDVAGEESVKSSIIADLLKYLEWNYQYDISVNELAMHKYFVNPSYLSRLFKAETGMTFSRYLTRLRMDKAAELLKQTGLKISDIALCVGYNDVSYFIQTFKKHYEMTPEQYKK